MIGNRRTLIVVPARGGSKGIRLKNLRTVGGVSLVALTGRVAAALPWVDRAVVSTDHEEIAAAAEAAGLAAPFRRPESLSGDRIGDLDVLLHALHEMERRDGVRYDVVVMLQPTCPLRRPEHVTATVEKLAAENLDAVWTVTETDLKMHPLKQLVVDANGLMTYYDRAGANIIARQQLQPVYHRNGAAYAIARECLVEQKSILGTRAGAVVIRDPLVNIDTPDDLAAADRQARA
ncbi:MAG TPA: acylneuraminate cytidylyltransferase family protein [Gammaproteobacteria bacterium]|jgi:CMP-N-acetylneuraminic acid synthetase|nr:acylneuraminate cytidylyltransferase family protein [Gammaproteobacteria bacterium]